MIATPTSPAIELICETLDAALANVVESTPSLIPLLKADPPCTYFGAVALAILSVSTPSFTACLSAMAANNNSDNSNDSVVLGVHGVPLKLSDCPAPLHPPMSKFTVIGHEAVQIEEEDTVVAIRLMQDSWDGEVAVPRLEHAHLELERGAGFDVDSGSKVRDIGQPLNIRNAMTSKGAVNPKPSQLRTRLHNPFDYVLALSCTLLYKFY
jgi:hypothetical protein